MGEFDILGPFDIIKAPYPSHYQTKALTKDGSLISIRPIRSDDAPLLVDLFNRLSKDTIFFRFLDDLKSLPRNWLQDFTRIDYAQDVAMVAVKEIESRDRILGVCRIMRKPGSTNGEIAVVVADHWQGKGIGKILLQKSIQIAKELGMRVLWGIVSSENKKILDMAEKLGFSIKPEPEADLYKIEMNLADGH
ncbi:MAG: N-acetyltransferase family protein [Desulfomonilaceae bacterium]